MTSKILGIRAENYKRIELVNIEFPPGGGTFAIMGQNEAGKSSTLDAIESAIAGRKAGKAVKPIRGGAESARVVATFDDIIVTRIYKPNGTTQITVTGTDGRKFANTEEIFAKLYSHVGLDPLAFSRLKDDEQVATLLPLIGYNPSKDDAERAREYELRTIQGREVTRLKGELSAYGDPVPGLPTEPVSVSALSAELEAALATHTAAASIQRTREQIPEGLAVYDERIAGMRVEIKRLTERMEADEKARGELAASDERLEAELAAIKTVDPEPIRAQIANAETTNRSIANNARRAEVKEQLEGAEESYSAMTARINAVDDRKAAALAKAKMPVPNLAIDPESMVLTLGGIPFSQASTGVKIRTGVAVAMALNPDLRLIVIRDASLLDSGNRAVIDELASANEFLVLMEIADESAEVGVVIEDGNVREVRA